MTTKPNLDDLHERLVRETFDHKLSDLDAFLIFTIFHTHQIELAGPVLEDQPQLERICAITQRHCSMILASLWSGTGDPREEYEYWYWRWNTDWESYQHAENLTDSESERFQQLIAQLESHPFVSQIVLED